MVAKVLKFKPIETEDSTVNEAEKRKGVYEAIRARIESGKLRQVIEDAARKIAMLNDGVVTSPMVAKKVETTAVLVGHVLGRSPNFEKVPAGTVKKGPNAGSPIFGKRKKGNTWTPTLFRYDPKPFKPRKSLKAPKRRKARDVDQEL